MPSPTRDTSERDLHQFNQQLRQQPFVQAWLRQRGKVDTGRGIQLSEQEREQFTQMLRANGVNIPNGMKVDGAGNFNQKNHLWRNVGIGAAVGGAALTGLGAAGIGPMSGLFGGGAAAAGGGAGAASGGTLASSSLPAASLMGGPAAITSGAVSAGVPLGGIAAGGAAGAAGAAAAGGGARGALSQIGRTFGSVDGVASLAPMIAALASGGMGGGGMSDDSNAFLQQAYGDAKARNDKAMARYDRTDPLHRMVTQLAEDRMPISSRRGIK